MQHEALEVQYAAQPAVPFTGGEIDQPRHKEKKMRDYGFLKDTKPKSGRYVARLFRYIDLGHQPDPVKGYAQCHRRVMLEWEIYGAGNRANGRPHTVGTIRTLSMHPKSILRSLIEGWLGCRLDNETAKDVRVMDLVGECGIADVTANGDFFVLNGLSPCPEGEEMPRPVNGVLVFDLLSSDESILKHVPSKVRAIIEKSREWLEVAAADGAGAVPSGAADLGES